MSSDEEEEIKQAAITKKSKNYTIADIMTMENTLIISKKKTTPAIKEESKGIKKEFRKKKHAKRSQKIVKF